MPTSSGPGPPSNLLPVLDKGLQRPKGSLGGKSVLATQHGLKGGKGTVMKVKCSATAQGLVEIDAGLVEAVGIALAKQRQEKKGCGIAGEKNGRLPCLRRSSLRSLCKEVQRLLQSPLDQGDPAAEPERIVVGVVVADLLDE